MADLISMLAAAAGAAAGGGETDPFFQDTVLLLHGDGTNGAQNNTFLDSSTNNFTITRNGNTTQGSFSPFSKPDGAWGNFFDGSGDYLSVADNAAFDFGTGDFTIEFWMRFAALPSSAAVAMLSTYSSGSDGYYIQYRTDLGGRNLRFGNSSTVFIDDTAFNPNVNQWYHIAVARSGTALRMYIDGVVSSSTATTSNNFVSTVPFLIGHLAAGTQPFNGYISNVRVVKGTAVYTSGFTPSTSPLTAIANTSLLTCQSNRFKDNSTNNFAITRNGDVKVTPFSPFPITTEYSPSVNGGSAYLDGSGDYLQAGSDAALAPGSGDFTIECWLYAIGNTNYMGFYQNYTDGNGRTTALRMSIYQTDNTRLAVQTAATALIVTSTGVLQPNAWNHIALVRNGAGSNNLVLYVNGTSAGTATNTTNFSDGYAQIGNTIYAGTNYTWNGGISSLRVVPGSAVYTSAFTPPTAPLTAIANTSLLCNFTNAGIFDNTGFNVLETVGDAQIDTTTKKYGTGSMEFDGTGDYLNGSDLISAIAGTEAYTLEAWIYPTSVTGRDFVIYETRSSSGSGFVFFINSSAKLQVYETSPTLHTQSTGTITANIWTHIALVRAAGSSTHTYYIDGVASGTFSLSSYPAATALRIGARNDGAEAFVGYIDDLRITKGVARYTTTFTPPTAAFPNIGA